MFKGIIVILLTLIIILFPIPLKITLKYRNKVLEIYIYNKKIKAKSPSKDKVNSKIKSIEKGIAKIDFFKSLTYNDIKLIIYKIKNLKFKPTMILNTYLEYGLDDAAFVAILYGLIHTSYSFLYLLLQNFVEVKKIDLKVTPHFEENDFNLEISSIIYTSLGKIIYMSFVMITCLISIKHKNSNLKKYKGGNVHG
ncbi:DUF2953 domain-containing protein [Clostridium estertheticum]|uniref:DUF2953 domain-containing protein n=1 Tax=Clostridium estertheticum TaxID=238834 RepID=UPI0013E90E5E|nr:DUF2953 domain-containing protein [Clostridium estertheticum]MBZ9687988.1 DUF2953 domain-containing protein [Clostridium estertheticum]